MAVMDSTDTTVFSPTLAYVYSQVVSDRREVFPAARRANPEPQRSFSDHTHNDNSPQKLSRLPKALSFLYKLPAEADLVKLQCSMTTRNPVYSNENHARIHT